MARENFLLLTVRGSKDGRVLENLFGEELYQNEWILAIEPRDLVTNMELVPPVRFCIGF